MPTRATASQDAWNEVWLTSAGLADNRGTSTVTLLAPLLLRLVPAGSIAAVGAWFLFDWIVDDAAISYAYARNAVRGLGLVSQAGRPPVEGFSNPLWVGLLAIPASFRSVPPHLALKCLSWTFQAAFLVAAACSTIARGIRLPAASLFLGLLALQPPLLIWSNSGLESPLLFFALLVLAEALAQTQRGATTGTVVLAGGAAAVCALTRPEGALLASGGLGVLVLSSASNRKLAHDAWLYITTMAVPVLAYVGFRKLYFHDWLPNTFYAKGGITRPRLLDAISLSPHAIAKVLEVAEALGGYFGATAVVVLLVTVTTYAARRRALTAWSRSYLALAVAAVLAYVLLPGDWMGEYRYAAPAALLLSMSMFHVTVDLWQQSGERPPSARSLAVLGGLIIAIAASWGWRVHGFRSHLPMPLPEVVDRARLFETAGQILGIERPSILTQDVGGFLLRDSVELYDVGMLTDRRAGRAIGEWRTDPDHRDLRSYVFEDLKPDFISVTAYHAWAARLGEDPRLSRDYVQVNTRRDEWIMRRYGVEMDSGDYVRKDRLRNPEDLVRLRRLLEASRGR